MKNIFPYLALVLVFALSGCEKVISISLNDGNHVPYVDAWITDQPGVQSVRFLHAVNYLDSSGPAPIADAQVRVTDLTAGASYDFNYSNGSYVYDAGAGRIGFTNHRYKLSLVWKGQQYEAYDTIKRNTVIDSITVRHRSASGGRKDGMYATFYATDVKGAPDYYWIRTYRNDSLNFYVGEMFSIDGGFTENISDGFEFLPPFREGITPREKPYVIGDVVKVVIRSLNRPSYDFGSRANDQIRNRGLFAKVLENVPTNINSLQSSSTKIYGWFGTVGEVSQSKKIQ